LAARLAARQARRLVPVPAVLEQPGRQQARLAPQARRQVRQPWLRRMRLQPETVAAADAARMYRVAATLAAASFARV
jgi:hypothetical protein